VGIHLCWKVGVAQLHGGLYDHCLIRASGSIVCRCLERETVNLATAITCSQSGDPGDSLLLSMHHHAKKGLERSVNLSLKARRSTCQSVVLRFDTGGAMEAAAGACPASCSETEPPRSALVGEEGSPAGFPNAQQLLLQGSIHALQLLDAGSLGYLLNIAVGAI